MLVRYVLDNEQQSVWISEGYESGVVIDGVTVAILNRHPELMEGDLRSRVTSEMFFDDCVLEFDLGDLDSMRDSVGS